MVSINDESIIDLAATREAIIMTMPKLFRLAHYFQLAKIERALANKGVFQISKYPFGFNWLVELYILGGRE